MILQLFNILFYIINFCIFIIDDSCISDVINTYLTTCNKKGIDYYRKKNQSDVNNVDNELEEEVNTNF